MANEKGILRWKGSGSDRVKKGMGKGGIGGLMIKNMRVIGCEVKLYQKGKGGMGRWGCGGYSR